MAATREPARPLHPSIPASGPRTRRGLDSIECGGIEIPRVFSFLPPSRQTVTAPTTRLRLPRPGRDAREGGEGSSARRDDPSEGKTRMTTTKRTGILSIKNVSSVVVCRAGGSRPVTGGGGGRGIRGRSDFSVTNAAPSPLLRGAPKERQQDQRQREEDDERYGYEDEARRDINAF